MARFIHVVVLILALSIPGKANPVDYDDPVVVRFARLDPVDDDCGHASKHTDHTTILDEVKAELKVCIANAMGHDYDDDTVAITGQTIDVDKMVEERAEEVFVAESKGEEPSPLVDNHDRRHLGSCNRPCIPQGHSCCISWPFICGSAGCSSCQCNRRRERRGLGEAHELLGPTMRHLTRRELSDVRSAVEAECSSHITALHETLLLAGNRCLGTVSGTIECTAHSEIFQTLD